MHIKATFQTPPVPGTVVPSREYDRQSANDIFTIKTNIKIIGISLLKLKCKLK